MSGLHTWGGLVFGWLLMAIFVAGTICVFNGPITAWMSGNPEREPGPLPGEQAAQAMTVAVQYLQQAAPDTHEWMIQLTKTRLNLQWHDADDVEHTASLSPTTGALLAAEDSLRDTTGGWNFVGFHYGLHAGLTGIVLVGFVTMAMLVALVSGIIVHKRIFKDFFTLRLFKGQRSWLDSHNIASVLTLPFLLMISYSGLVIFQGVWMPSSIAYHYGMPDGLNAELQLTSPYWEAQREAGQRRQALPPAPPLPAEMPLSALPALAQQAWQRTGQPVEGMARLSDGRLWLGMVAADDEALVRAEHITFRVVGDPPQLRQESFYAFSEAEDTRGVISVLHEARFGGWTVSWLWFLCGVAGCVMIATGLVLFTVKRQQRSANEFGVATPQVYRLIEALNVASVAGICLASIAYLWANRIIPVNMPGRADWEIRAFLLVWAATLLHALLRPSQRAWAEQLGLTALLCLALPLLNFFTTGDWFGRYAMQGHWAAFGVEVVALTCGALFILASVKVARARP